MREILAEFQSGISRVGLAKMDDRQATLLTGKQLDETLVGWLADTGLTMSG